MMNSNILTHKEERLIVDSITNLQKVYHSMALRSLKKDNCEVSKSILDAIDILQKDVITYKRIGELAKEFEKFLINNKK